MRSVISEALLRGRFFDSLKNNRRPAGTPAGLLLLFQSGQHLRLCGRRVDRLAAVTAKRAMPSSAPGSSSAGGVSRASSFATALPPKMSPAPVVSTGRTAGAGTRQAPLAFSR